MTHLYLIRHGEATTQVSQILRDDGLTPLGVTQAEHLRDRLAASHEIEADILISSTLPRARQTAEIIAPALKKEIEFDDEVQELRVGEAEGLTFTEFNEKYGGYKFDQEPFHPVSPGGESWGQFVLRVSGALDRITREHHGKKIVIVCHGGVIDSSFLYFFGMSALTLPPARFFTQNTSITYWRRSLSERRPPHWRLVRYNDDLHVRDIDAPARVSWDLLQLPRKPEAFLVQPITPPTEE